MLNLEGFYAVAQKKSPGCYGIKYRTRRLSDDSIEHRFLFSKRLMDELGWECGDYVWSGDNLDYEVFGFAKCEAGNEHAHKLRRKDATRTGCMIAVRGFLGLPECEHSTELEIVTDDFMPGEASLIARFPKCAV